MEVVDALIDNTDDNAAGIVLGPGAQEVGCASNAVAKMPKKRRRCSSNSVRTETKRLDFKV